MFQLFYTLLGFIQFFLCKLTHLIVCLFFQLSLLLLLLSVLMVCGLRIPKARAAYIFGAVFILVIYGSVWFRL